MSDQPTSGPPAGEPERTVSAPPPPPIANARGAGHPARVGPYEIVEPLGEGGMGIVYKAVQRRPVRRVVALKLVKPGMDSRAVLARFEAERQALAMMSHSNIA